MYMYIYFMPSCPVLCCPLLSGAVQRRPYVFPNHNVDNNDNNNNNHDSTNTGDMKTWL